jgi:hypothetical protein
LRRASHGKPRKLSLQDGHQANRSGVAPAALGNTLIEKMTLLHQAFHRGACRDRQYQHGLLFS